MTAKRVGDIEGCADVDARIACAAELLEHRLQQESPSNFRTLGQLVQEEPRFAGFFHDLVFALGVRDRIGHDKSHLDDKEAKARAASYLIHAVKVLDGLDPRILPPSSVCLAESVPASCNQSHAANPRASSRYESRAPNTHTSPTYESRTAKSDGASRRRERDKPAQETWQPRRSSHTTAAADPQAMANALKALAGAIGFVATAFTAIMLASMLLKAANEIDRPELLDPSRKTDTRLRPEEPEWSHYPLPAKKGLVPTPDSSGLPSGIGWERDNYGREGGFPSYPINQRDTQQPGPH